MSTTRARTIALTLATFAGIAYGQPSTESPDYWLSPSSGPLDTATLAAVWTDEERPELSTSDPTDRRKLLVHIWYPVAGIDGAEHASYSTSIHLYRDWVGDFFGPIVSTPTRSVTKGALPANPEHFPVIVYNPGAGFPAFTATNQTEFLASHGYIVVAVGRPESSSMRQFPNGDVFQADVTLESLSDQQMAEMSPTAIYKWRSDNPDQRSRLATQAADVAFVLDYLSRLGSDSELPFTGRMDLENVGVFGWSLGGATATQAAANDSRIKAVANLEGALYGRPVATTGLTKPVFLIQAARNAGEPSDGTADPDFEEVSAEMNRELWQMLRLTNADWYRAVILGADHNSFSDYYVTVPLPPSVAPAREVHAVVNPLLLEFFDRYLRGSKDSPLLDGLQSLPLLRIASRP